MAVKTKPQILSEIATLFADNNVQAISEADLRQVCNDMVDSFMISPYLIYRALVTQTGTSAPVVIELENTFSASPVHSYLGVGLFQATLAGAWVTDKTTVSITQNNNNGAGASGNFVQYFAWVDTNDVITYNAVDVDLTSGTSSGVNSAMTITEILIKVGV